MLTLIYSVNGATKGHVQKIHALMLAYLERRWRRVNRLSSMEQVLFLASGSPTVSCFLVQISILIQPQERKGANTAFQSDSTKGELGCLDFAKDVLDKRRAKRRELKGES
jgi:hypothetical protein